jgi:hypothetical protein
MRSNSRAAAGIRREPGVWVHFHDVFWPFEYREDWLRQKCALNEVYALRAAGLPIQVVVGVVVGDAAGVA